MTPNGASDGAHFSVDARRAFHDGARTKEVEMIRKTMTADDGGARLGKTWWRTPRALFDALNARFRFVLDACAGDCNALCLRYWTEADDALSQDWRVGGYVFCNWPFSRRTNPAFSAKIAEEARRGAQIVALGPASPNAQYWHTLTGACHEVWCFDGRLSYGDPVTGDVQRGAQFDSALYVFHGGPPPPVGPFLGRMLPDGTPVGRRSVLAWQMAVVDVR